MTDYYKNFASSTIAGGAGGSGTSLASGDTSLLLQSGDGAQFGSSYPFWCVLNGVGPTREIVKVTARSTDTLTIVRGQDGTSAATWATTTTVDLIIAAIGMTNLWSEIATIEGDHFILGQNGQNDTNLTNGIVIPGLSGSSDIRAGGSNDVEFDSSSTTGWSSFAGGGAVSSWDFNTTAKSHAYLKVATNSSSDKFGGIIHAVAPSIPYTVTAKLTDATYGQNGVWPALFVSDSSTAAGQSVFIGNYERNSQNAYVRGGSVSNLQTFATYSDTFLSAGIPTQTPIYFRIIVHAANNVDILCSLGGMVWTTVHTGFSNMSTAGYFGVAVDTFGAACEMMWDWIRFS